MGAVMIMMMIIMLMAPTSFAAVAFPVDSTAPAKTAPCSEVCFGSGTSPKVSAQEPETALRTTLSGETSLWHTGCFLSRIQGMDCQTTH